MTEDDHYQMEAETIDHHGRKNNRNLAFMTTRQGQGWTDPTTALYQTDPTRAPYQTYPTRALYQTEPTRALYQTDPTARPSGMYRVSHIIGPTLFFAILSASTIPKYKKWVSVKKFRKFAIR